MKRITVIAEDCKGLIAELSELLADNGINIPSIHAQTDGENAFVRLRAEPYDQALVLLRDNGYQAISDEVIILRIKNEPGSLARIARKLADNNVDIRGITMIQAAGPFCIVAVATNNQDLSCKILKEHLLEI